MHGKFYKHVCSHELNIFFIYFGFNVQANHGYRNLTGIDYSPASIQLARQVLLAEDLTDVTVKVGSL